MSADDKVGKDGTNESQRSDYSLVNEKLTNENLTPFNDCEFLRSYIMTYLMDTGIMDKQIDNIVHRILLNVISVFVLCYFV